MEILQNCGGDKGSHFPSHFTEEFVRLSLIKIFSSFSNQMMAEWDLYVEEELRVITCRGYKPPRRF